MLIIELTEYESKLYPRQQISQKAIAFLRNNYSSQVKITIKDTKKGDYWQFKAQGWVGYIPVDSQIAMRIMPKIPIANLFGMLKYAYNLKSFKFLDGVTKSATLTDFYNRFVKLFCELILQQYHRGLYKTYIDRSTRSTYIRGRLDLKQTIKKPWDSKVICHYPEQTTDIKENQIIFWTLYLISCNHLCNEANKSLIRSIYRQLQYSIRLKPFTVLDLASFKYNRLNQDYQKIHILCRFFLANLMPSHDTGNLLMLPFLVNMAQLYEEFVAQWLKVNLPKNYELNIQKKVNLAICNFQIDLVICDAKTKKAICVLDTKYKNSSKPSNNDIYQINTYATSQQCDRAILIYPQKLKHSIAEKIDNVRVESSIFSLQDDLEKSGQYFMKTLLRI